MLKKIIKKLIKIKTRIYIKEIIPNIKFRLSKQKKISIKGKNILDVYYDPRLDGEFRCDLHPKLDKKTKIICIDSTFKGVSEA